MATPTKTKTGLWTTRVYVGKDAAGKAVYKRVTASSKRECSAMALEITSHKREVRLDSCAQTLGEAIDGYISTKSNLLSPATIRGYTNIRRNRFQPEMDMRCSALTQKRLQIAINREAAEVGEKSIRNAIGLIKSAMAYAGVEDVDRYKLTLPQRKKYEARPLQPDEIPKLMQAAQGSPYEVPILMALILGLRRSEILGAKWDAYDANSRHIAIKCAIVPDAEGKMVEKGTKTTESERVLSVPPYLADLMERLPRESDFIVNFCPSAISKNLNKLCDKAGISRRGLHDLRHTNASVMLMLGVGDKYAMERGGWSSSKTMRSIYQHTYDSKMTAVDDMMTAFFFEKT